MLNTAPKGPGPASLSDISCTLLPGNFPRAEVVPPLYNRVYDSWHRTWKEVFTSVGSPESLNPENFLRQDILIVLHREREVVGLLTTTFLNLSARAVVDHPYFRPFPEPILRAFQRRGRGLVLTGEYLSIDPAYRRSIVGLSLSDVLIGLLMRIFTGSGADSTLATTVRPAGVHEICHRFGYRELGGYQKYGLDCVLMQNDPSTVREHDDPRVRSLIESFWESRCDLTGLTGLTDLTDLTSLPPAVARNEAA